MTQVIPSTASKVAIGARDNNGANSISSGNFTIGELIFYSKGLTKARAMIEGYLQDKVDGGILQADQVQDHG